MANITTTSPAFNLVPKVCSHESETPGHRRYMTLSWEDPENDLGDVTIFLELDEAERVGRALFETAVAAKMGKITGYT